MLRTKALLLPLLVALTGCELAGTATTHNTFLVLLSDCNKNELTDECRLRPIERLDITVSPSAQRVAWKKTSLDGVTTDYVTGTKCVVVGSRDFHCAELSQDGDKVVPDLVMGDWSELFFKGVIVDEHLYSWCLWYVSSANAPANVSKGQFDLLANTFVSVIAVAVAAIAGMFAWAWLQTKL
jgi:hypothetical protein